MNSYSIFAIVLTVAYLIYYAVIVAHDLYGKKKMSKTSEEVFDLGEPEEEESIAVSDSETGFSIGEDKYETEGTTTASPETPGGEAETPDTTQEKFERLKAKAEERMEETAPYLSDARTADEMYKAMISRGRIENRPEMMWKPIQDRL